MAAKRMIKSRIRYFSLESEDGVNIEHDVEAEIIGEPELFGVHRKPRPDGEPGKYWSLTHLPTSQNLHSFTKKWKAAGAARELAAMAAAHDLGAQGKGDWYCHGTHVMRHSSIWRAAYHVMARWAVAPTAKEARDAS